MKNSRFRGALLRAIRHLVVYFTLMAGPLSSLFFIWFVWMARGGRWKFQLPWHNPYGYLFYQIEGDFLVFGLSAIVLALVSVLTAIVFLVRGRRRLLSIIAITVLVGCACAIYGVFRTAENTDRVDCRKLKEKWAMNDTVILDYGDYDAMFPPATYCEADLIDHIFAVPEKNAVGTNDIGNAISLLRFKTDDKLNRVVVKKDFMEMVNGPFEFRFLPVWSREEIAYSQSKGFLLVNIPEKKVGIHTVCPGLNDEIGGLAVLGGKEHTFVFEIRKPYAAIQGFKKVLRVVRFENDTFTVLSERPAGLKTSSYSEPWFTYQNRIFVYNDSSTRIEVFDEKFQPVSHPLAEAFNANSKSFRCLQEIVLHPTSPLAIIIEMGKDPDVSKFDSLSPAARLAAITPLYDEVSRLTLYLFRWTHSDPKQRFVPLISSAGSIWKSYKPSNNYDDFTFSPDGKWVVFRDHSKDSKNPVFVAVPVDEKNPLLLGKPIKLGRAIREGATGPTGTAWATDPTSFVMCDGAVIYKWDLENVSKMRKEKVPSGTVDPWIKKGK